MNLVLYLSMVVAGYLGALYEQMFNRSSKWLLGTTVVLFVLTACSRLGYSYAYSDLTEYIHYFLDDNDVYFEPGYVFLTDSIKFVFGDEPLVLIGFIALWVVAAVLLSDLICTRQYGWDDQEEVNFYPSTLILVVILYWGCSFACEGLRNGLAISLLFCASSLAINEREGYATLICLSALLFHYSVILFLPGILALWIIKQFNRDVYIYWFVVLIVLDIIMATVITFQIPFVSDIFNLMGEIEMLSHYDNYNNEDAGSYFSTQYVTYHLFGLLMLLGDLNDKKYNRAVMLYYIGLTLGTLFSTSIIVMRIQWLYLSMVVFVLYYFLRDQKWDLWKKQSVLVSYMLIESVMVLRYLGWHI